MFIVLTFQAAVDLVGSTADDDNVPERDKKQKWKLSPVIKNTAEKSDGPA